MAVVVAEVKGTVQVSTDDGKSGRWRRWRCGGPGAQFRTGFRSSVTCVIPPDQQFTLESLGTVKVAEAAKAGERVKTDLVMKYGARRLPDRGGGRRARVHHPHAGQHAFRPGHHRAGDRPRRLRPDRRGLPAAPCSRRGVARPPPREERAAGMPRSAAKDGSAAQTGLAQTVIDPNTAAARTASEARLIARQTSRAPSFPSTTCPNIPVITGAPGRYRTPSLSPACRGRWISFSAGPATRTSTSSCPTSRSRQPTLPRAGTLPRRSLQVGAAGLSDANLGQVGILGSSKSFQQTELLYPGFGLNTSASGGIIPYDHRGGPNGGMEVAYWLNSPPQGIFVVSAVLQSGKAADYKIDAFLGGKPLSQIYFSTDGTLFKTNELNGTIAAAAKSFDTITSVVLSPGNSFYNNAVPTGDGKGGDLPVAAAERAGASVPAPRRWVGRTAKPPTTPAASPAGQAAAATPHYAGANSAPNPPVPLPAGRGGR